MNKVISLEFQERVFEILGNSFLHKSKKNHNNKIFSTLKIQITNSFLYYRFIHLTHKLLKENPFVRICLNRGKEKRNFNLTTQYTSVSFTYFLKLRMTSSNRRHKIEMARKIHVSAKSRATTFYWKYLLKFVVRLTSFLEFYCSKTIKTENKKKQLLKMRKTDRFSL